MYTLLCLNIGTPKYINFPFGTNGKLMYLGALILMYFRTGILVKLKLQTAQIQVRQPIVSICNFLLLSKTIICKKWLPAQTVFVILLPVDSVSRRHCRHEAYLSCTAVLAAKDRKQSQQKPCLMDSLGRNRKLAY